MHFGFWKYLFTVELCSPYGHGDGTSLSTNDINEQMLGEY